jgi:hypothetical protein
VATDGKSSGDSDSVGVGLGVSLEGAGAGFGVLTTGSSDPHADSSATISAATARRARMSVLRATWVPPSSQD